MTAPAPRSRKKPYGSILILGVVLVAAAVVYIVYRNNAELFAKKPVSSAAGVQDQEAPPPVESRPSGTAAPQGRNRPFRDTAAARPTQKTEVRADSGAASAPPKLRQSVTVPDIDCAILGQSTVHVELSLELFFEDDGMRDEILAKREQLKVMVRKVLSTKRFDEIQVEPLRAELRDAMNRILSTGVITDIEFRAFRVQ